jgi:hypothetical protein
VDLIRNTLRDREAFRLALALSDAILLYRAKLIDYADDEPSGDLGRASFMVLRALPNHDAIEAQHQDFINALTNTSGDLARTYDYLIGERDGLLERSSFLIGLAIGSRLGRDLIERAAFPRREGGAA